MLANMVPQNRVLSLAVKECAAISQAKLVCAFVVSCSEAQRACQLFLVCSLTLLCVGELASTLNEASSLTQRPTKQGEFHFCSFVNRHQHGQLFCRKVGEARGPDGGVHSSDWHGGLRSFGTQSADVHCIVKGGKTGQHVPREQLNMNINSALSC